MKHPNIQIDYRADDFLDFKIKKQIKIDNPISPWKLMSYLISPYYILVFLSSEEQAEKQTDDSCTTIFIFKLHIKNWCIFLLNLLNLINLLNLLDLFFIYYIKTVYHFVGLSSAQSIAILQAMSILSLLMSYLLF